MDLDAAIELVREALSVALLVGAPVLAVSLVVALAISLMQAVTQIQEQTLNLVPRILLMALTTFLVLPWMIQRLVDYATTLFHEIPSKL